jgi:hypothetical protein
LHHSYDVAPMGLSNRNPHHLVDRSVRKESALLSELELKSCATPMTHLSTFVGGSCWIVIVRLLLQAFSRTAQHHGTLSPSETLSDNPYDPLPPLLVIVSHSCVLLSSTVSRDTLPSPCCSNSATRPPKRIVAYETRHSHIL